MGNYILTMKDRGLRLTIALLMGALLLVASGPGFRSRRLFEEHYAKHGREFGSISPHEYLERAQALRTRPPAVRSCKP